MSSVDRRASQTHERAVLEQDNGELAEDVVEKRDGKRGSRTSDKLDEEGKESFPASDAPSSWGGPPTEDGRGNEGADHGRVVDHTEVEHPAERVAPDDPVPRTLPLDDEQDADNDGD